MAIRHERASPLPTAVSLPDPPNGWRPVRYAALADGALAVLTTNANLDAEHSRIDAAMQTAPFRLDDPDRIRALAEQASAQILTLEGSCWRQGPTFPLESPCAMLDRFPDGRWLIVAARTHGDCNARVLAPDGALLGRIRLGDGIEHIAIDATGRIWVGWFDEGVFGNDDWRSPGQKWPPSSHGLACFGEDGSLLQTPAWPASATHIADCYALNVHGSSAWACPYTDFPLVHFGADASVRWWRSGIAGPSAIAFDGGYALIAGGYQKDANRLVLFELPGAGQGEPARLISSGSMPLRPLPPGPNEYSPVWARPALLTGRGDTVHLVDAGIWRRWRVAAG